MYTLSYIYGNYRMKREKNESNKRAWIAPSFDAFRINIRARKQMTHIFMLDDKRLVIM